MKCRKNCKIILKYKANTTPIWLHLVSIRCHIHSLFTRRITPNYSNLPPNRAKNSYIYPKIG